MSDAPPPGATATGLYAHADFPAGSLIAGRFRIEGVLGVGGMGVVYRARDEALGVSVALKLLRPELAARPDAFERFRQELLLARQVSSPHVVRIHDLARHGERWLISMDFVEGEALDRRLDRDGALALEEALRITRDIAEGLAAAHDTGVVHRDLKPANILLDAQGRAFISDFGVARSLAGVGMTATGAVVGTPEYLSPEQARGGAVDARSDLYALGLILYEMLVGKPPFSGATAAEILAQRLVRVPEPVSRRRSGIPPWVARLVEKLLRPQPAHRFASAREVVAAIDRQEVAREFRPGRGMALAVAAVLAVTVIAGGWWWRSQQAAPPAADLASAPLRRLLVLPIDMPAGDDALAARMTAAGAQLRDAIAELPGVAVVDRQRSWQAVRMAGAAAGDPAALRRLAAAERILQLHARPAAPGWRIQAILHTPSAAPVRIDGPVAADPVAALEAWAKRPETATALGLPTPIPDLDLPAMRALQAHGEALQAARRGDIAGVLKGSLEATGHEPGYTRAWLDQAEAAQAIGDEDAAFAAIEGGRATLERAPARLRQRYLATRALLEGDAPTAVSHWRALADANPDDTEIALQLARARGTGGDFKAAVTSLQALTARDAQDPRAWFELGKFSILSGDAQRAVDDYLVRALVLYKRSGDAFGEAETVNALGIGYGRLGQTADAEEQYRKAIALRSRIGNRRGEATSRSNLAATLSLRGDYAEAARQLEQARLLRVALDDRAGLAAVEHDLGLLAEERGDYALALAAYRRSLQAWENVGNKHGVAQALDGIGFARYQMGAYADAHAYWQQAAQTYAALGDETGNIRTSQNLGLLAVSRGQWRMARTLLKQSLAAAERLQMTEEAAVSHRHLAELERMQGHYEAALSQAGEALAAFRRREDARGETDAGLLRVQVLLDLHADAQAQHALSALSPALAKAPGEQRAMAAMLEGLLAERRGDAGAARRHFADAARRARMSGVLALQLQAALHGGGNGDLEAQSASLGHVGLRLDGVERAMGRALARNDAAGAVAAYRQAQPLLRAGDYRRAWALHRLAARALAAEGRQQEAQVAATAASRAWEELLSQAPPEHREALRRATSAGTRP